MAEKDRFTLLEILGIAGAGAGFYEYGAGPVRNFSEGLGQAYDALISAGKLLAPKDSLKTEYVDRFISQIDPKVEEAYRKSKDIGYGQRITEVSREAIEAMQRHARAVGRIRSSTSRLPADGKDTAANVDASPGSQRKIHRELEERGAVDRSGGRIEGQPDTRPRTARLVTHEG